MFSILTNQKIIDDICNFQSGVVSVGPMIYSFRESDSKLMQKLNLQDIFLTEKNFEKIVKLINREQNGKEKYSPNQNKITISFVLAVSDKGKLIPYMATAEKIDVNKKEKIEGQLNLNLIKLTDNLYRLEGGYKPSKTQFKEK